MFKLFNVLIEFNIRIFDRFWVLFTVFFSLIKTVFFSLINNIFKRNKKILQRFYFTHDWPGDRSIIYNITFQCISSSIFLPRWHVQWSVNTNIRCTRLGLMKAHLCLRGNFSKSSVDVFSPFFLSFGRDDKSLSINCLQGVRNPNQPHKIWYVSKIAISSRRNTENTTNFKPLRILLTLPLPL